MTIIADLIGSFVNVYNRFFLSVSNVIFYREQYLSRKAQKKIKKAKGGKRASADAVSILSCVVFIRYHFFHRLSLPKIP